MVKENPCNKCCSFNTNYICECNELSNYRHYQQGRADAYKDVLVTIEAGVCDYCQYRDMENKCFNKCTHELEALKEWLKEKE